MELLESGTYSLWDLAAALSSPVSVMSCCARPSSVLMLPYNFQMIQTIRRISLNDQGNWKNFRRYFASAIDFSTETYHGAAGFSTSNGWVSRASFVSHLESSSESNRKN